MREELIRWMPALNASLNGVALCFLVAGFVLIRRRRIESHRRAMLGAFSMSVLFLISYVIYHTLKGDVHTRWEMPGVLQKVYYFILITHIILAAIVPFLAVVTLRRGLKREDVRHRRIARITWPIWVYVSVTGVLVYAMLYHLYPAISGGA